MIDNQNYFKTFSTTLKAFKVHSEQIPREYFTPFPLCRKGVKYSGVRWLK